MKQSKRQAAGKPVATRPSADSSSPDLGPALGLTRARIAALAKTIRGEDKDDPPPSSDFARVAGPDISPDSHKNFEIFDARPSDQKLFSQEKAVPPGEQLGYPGKNSVPRVKLVTRVT